MSEVEAEKEEKRSVAEVPLPIIRSSKAIKDLINDFCYVEVDGIVVYARQPSDVVREALLKGLAQMVKERDEKKAKEEAARDVKKKNEVD